MKVAVCHDRLMERSGGERVAITLARMFDADLYVTRYSPENTFEAAKKLKVIEISPSMEPPISQLYTLIWMNDSIKFSKLRRLSDYDLLITSGQLAHFASIQNQKNIWYCHTPNRALYDLRNEVRERLGFFWKPWFELWAKFWKSFDQKSVRCINKIVVNSKNVQRRVQKFYERCSTVVYPPVNIKKFHFKPAENYWLSVQRVEPEKRIEIQLKAFEKLRNEKLILVGPGKYKKSYIQKISRWIKNMPNVTWKTSVSEKKLIDLYARCKGVIQTAIDEDFGLVTIESMASGKPCIAVAEGGFKETIIHGKTGLLLKKPYVENLIKTIKNFDKYTFNPKTCINRAMKFSEEEFIKKMKSIAKKVLVNS